MSVFSLAQLLIMVHSERVLSCSICLIFPFFVFVSFVRLCYVLLCSVIFCYVLLCFVMLYCVLLHFVFVSAYLKVGLPPFFPHLFFFVDAVCCCVLLVYLLAWYCLLPTNSEICLLPTNSQAPESGLVALQAPHFLERG